MQRPPGMINESNSDLIHISCPLSLSPLTDTRRCHGDHNPERCLSDGVIFTAPQICLFLCVMCVCTCVCVQRRGARWVMRPGRFHGGQRWCCAWCAARLGMRLFVFLLEFYTNTSVLREKYTSDFVVWIFVLQVCFLCSWGFIFLLWCEEILLVKGEKKSFQINQWLSACVVWSLATERQEDVNQTYLIAHIHFALLQKNREFLSGILLCPVWMGFDAF